MLPDDDSNRATKGAQVASKKAAKDIGDALSATWEWKRGWSSMTQNKVVPVIVSWTRLNKMFVIHIAGQEEMFLVACDNGVGNGN